METRNRDGGVELSHSGKVDLAGDQTPAMFLMAPLSRNTPARRRRRRWLWDEQSCSAGPRHYLGRKVQCKMLETGPVGFTGGWSIKSILLF